MFASGVGANGNATLGASTVGGMLLGMLLQIFLVPTLFIIFQALQERIKPLQSADLLPSTQASNQDDPQA